MLTSNCRVGMGALLQRYPARKPKPQPSCSTLNLERKHAAQRVTFSGSERPATCFLLSYELHRITPMDHKSFHIPPLDYNVKNYARSNVYVYMSVCLPVCMYVCMYVCV